MSTLNQIMEKSLSGLRLTREEGLTLYREAPLGDLGDLAHALRMKKVPGGRVTFVIDTNLNYSNVCDAYCTFCAFYRTEKDQDAYTFSVPEMVEKVKRSVQKYGVTTVLIQGGLNPGIPFSYYTDFVSAVRREVPEVHPHFFSAPEIWKMVEVTGRDIRWVLTELKKAGLDTLPGGGAEVLSDRVRLKLSRTKVDTANWLKVHETAHELGYRSTATMMFGHLDEDVDILDHLQAVRAVQDRTQGFTAFIPWSFKPDNTALARKVKEAPGAAAYLRVLALARVFLDNFDHVQGSWFSEGKKTGQMSLYFGADDFGGTIFEENVMHEANYDCKATTDEVVRIIQEAGFTPAQRTTKYEVVKVFEGPQAVGAVAAA